MILNDKIGKDSFSKPEIGKLEQEKQEYKLIGKFIRRKGLKLFSYNHLANELLEVKTKNKDMVEMIIGDDGQVGTPDISTEEVTVDTRNIHFEALNEKTATNRIRKWKDGKIKDLYNLRKCNPDGMRLF